MQISGEWLLCDDDVRRPVIRGEVLASDGTWVSAEFLVDTGADRTVFSAGLLALLRVSPVATGERLSGLGGVAEFVTVETEIRLIPESGAPVTFQGQYAATSREIRPIERIQVFSPTKANREKYASEVKNPQQAGGSLLRASTGHRPIRSWRPREVTSYRCSR